MTPCFNNTFCCNCILKSKEDVTRRSRKFSHWSYWRGTNLENALLLIPVPLCNFTKAVLSMVESKHKSCAQLVHYVHQLKS